MGSGVADGRLGALLRSEGRFAADSTQLPIRDLSLFFLAGGLLYGTAMGTFGSRPSQMLYSSVKVPLLLIATTFMCLPSFFVLNAILGLREDFVSAFKAVIAAQATFAVALASMAPLTLVCYVSTADYRFALNFNGLPWLVALVAAQVTLSRHYRRLIGRNPRHRVAVWTWLVIFALVAIQLSWVLRPFVGDPSLPPAFSREDAWSNAYLEIWDDLRKLAAGG